MNNHKKENDQILQIKNKKHVKAKFDMLESTDNLFIFYAKQRSGHHGVLDWMRHKFDNNIHFNDPDLGKSIVDTSTKFWSNDHIFHNKELENPNPNPRSVFVNYENYFFDEKTIENEESMIKKSFFKRPKNIFRVLVLRDYLNNLASSLKNEHQLKFFTEMWVNHANEFIGNTNYINETLYIVNYNNWFDSNSYRYQIQDQFEFDKPETQHFKVSQHGGGSSFDGVKEENPFNMNVLERYKELSDDVIISFLKNQELIEFQKIIFNNLVTHEKL